MSRRRAIALLRTTSIVATAYLVVAEVGREGVSLTTAALVGAALASNIVLRWVPESTCASTRFTGAVMLVDTAWITVVLLSAGRFGGELFYLYFFVLFLAGIGESVKLIAVGSIVTVVAYLVAAGGSADARFAWSASTLMRIPFFLAIATFYGYLIDRVRQEHLAARSEAAAAEELREAKKLLAEHARRVEAVNEELAREVGERRRAEEGLVRANEELTRMSELKSDFVAMVAHEIKGPLTSLRSVVDILRKGRAGELAEQQVRFVQMAHRNVTRLRRIAGDLLDLSKIEAGKLEFSFGDVDVARLCSELVLSHAAAAEERQLSLVLEAEEGLPEVWADGDRVEQVVTNLVTNAMKFTPEGGQITVALSDAPEGVEVSVIDTGIGLTPEEQERIFDRFYQTQDRGRGESRGTGLGLCISRELVAAHGGTLAVESERGKGSRFHFRLRTASRVDASVTPVPVAAARPRLTA